MEDRDVTISVADSALISGSQGLSIARRVLSNADPEVRVVLDLRATLRITPSCANALVMTLLDAWDAKDLQHRLDLRCDHEPVLREWRRAVARYQRGIRLSTQRSGAA